MRVLITGGSRGIGLAIAQELAAQGHELLLVARDLGRLESVQRLMRQTYASSILVRQCDLAFYDQIAALHRFCEDEGFIPDVLILNAGIFIDGTLTESSSESYLDTINVNLNSCVFMVRLFVDDLRQSLEKPTVILIGSTAAYEAYPIGSLYGVAKWGLRGYAINLRKELMKDNIAVTFIAPGGTLTDLWAGEELAADRLLEPRDIGKIVAMTLNLSRQAVVEEVIVRPMLGDIHE